MLKLLLKIFYIKIPDRILKKIIEKKTISSLETILESGHYKNRIFIYENLENIEFDNRKGLLKILINDSIKKLSEGAINALTLFELSEDEKRII
ncbi:hypothetical protein [uncultured Tenacibaculum sp.]|uniref:hypothetical protein n=1 Tax=uncultured Tenacibaculum sp. TaxID=174713 RepID=UPI00261094A8|nr:hypothetical protein [uncultured Tenacibaculum sp.]